MNGNSDRKTQNAPKLFSVYKELVRVPGLTTLPQVLESPNVYKTREDTSENERRFTGAKCLKTHVSRGVLPTTPIEMRPSEPVSWTAQVPEVTKDSPSCGHMDSHGHPHCPQLNPQKHTGSPSLWTQFFLYTRGKRVFCRALSVYFLKGGEEKKINRRRGEEGKQKRTKKNTRVRSIQGVTSWFHR